MKTFAAQRTRFPSKVVAQCSDCAQCQREVPKDVRKKVRTRTHVKETRHHAKYVDDCDFRYDRSSEEVTFARSERRRTVAREDGGPTFALRRPSRSAPREDGGPTFALRRPLRSAPREDGGPTFVLRRPSPTFARDKDGATFARRESSLKIAHVHATDGKDDVPHPEFSSWGGDSPWYGTIYDVELHMIANTSPSPDEWSDEWSDDWVPTPETPVESE